MDDSEEEQVVSVKRKHQKHTSRLKDKPDEDISKMIITCTACGKRVPKRYLHTAMKHIHLSVLTCEKCFDFYGDGEFSRDETGDEYCRWCADGGELITCDNCTNAFCTACIEHNMGNEELKNIQGKDNWQCYVCDPEPLKPLVKFCKRVFSYLKSELKKKHEDDMVTIDSNDSASQDDSQQHSSWATPLVEETKNAIEVLSRRISKVSHKLSNSDGPPHVYKCISKLKKLLNKHNKYIEYILADIKKGLEENGVEENGDEENCDELAQTQPLPRTKLCNGHETVDSKEEGTSTGDRRDDLSSNLAEGEVSSIQENNLSSSEKVDEESLLPADKTSSKNKGLTVQDNQEDDVLSNSSNHPEDDPDETLANLDHDISETEQEQKEDDVELPHCGKEAVEQIPSADENCDNATVEDNLVSSDPDNETDELNGTKSVDKEEEEEEESVLADVNEKNKLSKSKKSSIGLSSDDGLLLESSSSESDLNNESTHAVKNRKILTTESEEEEEEEEVETGDGKISQEINPDFEPDSLNSNGLGDKENEEVIKEKTGDDKMPLGIKTELDSDSLNLTFLGDKKNEEARMTLLSELYLSPPSKAKRKRSFSSTSSESESNFNYSGVVERLITSLDHQNDEKLKGRPVVVLERLELPDNVLEEVLSSKKTSKPKKKRQHFENAEKSIDDIISNLSAIPKNKPKKKLSSASNSDSSDSSGEFENTKPVKKKVTPPKKMPSKLLVSSDSSDDLFSDGASKKKLLKKEEPEKPKSQNTLAKDALLIDSSSESSSDVELVIPKKQSKPSKGSSKASKPADSADSDSSSSSVEFVKHNKYSKLDKLLRARQERKERLESRNKENKDQDKGKSSKTGKKVKKIKIGSEDGSGLSSSSDSSESNSDSLDHTPKKKNKKRKRIKNMSSSDEKDNEEKEGETPDTPSNKGRKNIRKLIGDKALGKQTKLASVAERERRERVKARQELYNEVTEAGGDFGEQVTKRLVLESVPETKEPLVEVPKCIITKLKPHQVDGVKFMWECVIESLTRLEDEKDEGSGGVLAHCMGLGKTLQVITFVSTLLNNERVNKKIKTVLVTCPLNTIRNWSREFEMWLGDTEAEVNVFEIVDVKDQYSRADVLAHWQKAGGVMIMSYEQFRSLLNARKASKKCKVTFEKALVDPGPDLVVCDEGHVLKNITSTLAKAMSRIKTKRRLVLTGTPLQNNLIEYHCMIQFVKPHLLGSKKEFQNRFVNPISNGQCADSNDTDVKLMKKRVHILHKLLEGCVQRCDYNHVTKYLLPKYEFVISVRLSEVQISLYRLYLKQFSTNRERVVNEDGEEEGPKKGTVGAGLFKDHHMLKLIWTHPYLLQMQKKKADIKAILEEDSMSSFINDDSNSDSNQASPDNDADEVVCLSDDPKPSTSRKRKTRSNKEDDSDVEEVVSNWKTRSRGNQEQSESEEEGPRNDQWWNEFIAEEELTKIELSGKMLLLFEILKQCELVGDKVLLFTQSLLSLDLLEELLQKKNEEHRANTEVQALDEIGTWVNGIDYFRMDGSTSADVRKKYIQVFNNPANERARLFMISTKAGSLGTNLVGANRVVILDASWNPTHDVQAIFRVYRFGQTKPVYVYRLLAQGSMEEKIYDRQVTKQSMASRVVDEQQIERHFNAADLIALYSFDPDSKTNRPTPMVPKDRLLAELLIKEETKDWIVTYHEHDSLLENVTAEELTEDERKVAWAEYEAEREGLLNQQGGQMNAVMMFLMEILEKYPTDNLAELLNKIKEERPEANKVDMVNYLYMLGKICGTKLNELHIVSTNLTKNNEALPKDMTTRIKTLQTLLSQINIFKEKQNQLRTQQLLEQRAQEIRRDQLNQMRQLYQQRMQQQQQPQPNFQQQFPQQHAGLKNNVTFVQMASAQGQRIIQGLQANMNRHNGNVMGQQTPNPRTYFGHNRPNVITTVTQRPIITEAVDDQPSSTTNTLSGPVITEIE